jgi:hypothetical protein
MVYPANMDIAIAERCAILGLSRAQAEELARAGPFPCHLYQALGIGESNKKDWLKLAAQTAGVSYRGLLTAETLLAVLVSGTIPSGFAAHIYHLLEEAPIRVLVGAVEQAAERSGMPIVGIWRNVHQFGTKRFRGAWNSTKP